MARWKPPFQEMEVILIPASLTECIMVPWFQDSLSIRTVVLRPLPLPVRLTFLLLWEWENLCVVHQLTCLFPLLDWSPLPSFLLILSLFSWRISWSCWFCWKWRTLWWWWFAMDDCWRYVRWCWNDFYARLPVLCTFFLTIIICLNWCRGNRPFGNVPSTKNGRWQ